MTEFPGKARLVELLSQEALRRGEFTLASGRKSHYYVDGRRVTLSAEGAALIGQGMLEAIARWDRIEAIGGLTLGADPVVAATLTWAGVRGQTDLRGFLVRKQAKQHGTGQMVEGPLEPGMRTLILDDVATTGGSSWKAVQAAREAGAEVLGAIVVLDRLEGASERLADLGVPLIALVTIRDLGVEPLGPESDRPTSLLPPDHALDLD